MSRHGVGNVEDRVLRVVLGLVFLASLVIAIYEEVTNLKIASSWNTPVILACLFAIMRLVGPLPQIRSDVTYLREVADVSVQRMPTPTNFYRGLLAGLEEAESSVFLTHIRDQPPTNFGPEADAFFERLLDWCTKKEGRLVRRIIAVRNVAMYEWARSLAERTEHLPQFQVRVIEWAPQAPALNMAIMDEVAVYLALTGDDAQTTRGLGIEDVVSAQYFREYYTNLWRSSVDLADWLHQDSREGGQLGHSPQQAPGHLRLESQ